MTMGKHDLTIFRYSTILTLTRNGIDTLERLDGMTNEQMREYCTKVFPTLKRWKKA